MPRNVSLFKCGLVYHSLTGGMIRHRWEILLTLWPGKDRAECCNRTSGTLSERYSSDTAQTDLFCITIIRPATASVRQYLYHCAWSGTLSPRVAP
eukprot:357369-Chlamydomonas_euryale.AAC.6